MSEAAEQVQLSEALAEEVEEPTGWIIPFNLSLEKLDKITKACFAAKADKGPVSVDDVSRIAGIHARTVAPNIRFLAAIGIVEQQGDEGFTLSAKGAEYAKQLGSGDLQKAGAILKEILPESHLNELIGFSQVEGTGLNYDAIFNHIKTLARLKEDEEGDVSAPFKAGIRCLISLLARGEFVSSDLLEEPKVSRSAGLTERKTRQAKESTRAESKGGLKSSPSGAGLKSDAFSPFNLNISIEAKDPESIKQVMELIKFLRDNQKE